MGIGGGGSGRSGVVKKEKKIVEGKLTLYKYVPG
jgi:hypothetical protein